MQHFHIVAKSLLNNEMRNMDIVNYYRVTVMWDDLKTNTSACNKKKPCIIEFEITAADFHSHRACACSFEMSKDISIY